MAKILDEAQRQRHCSKCGEGGHRASTCKGPGLNAAPAALRASSEIEIAGFVRLAVASERAGVDNATVRLWAERAQASLDVAATGNTRGAVFIKEVWLDDWIAKRKREAEAREAEAREAPSPPPPNGANGTHGDGLTQSMRAAINNALEVRSLNFKHVRAGIIAELREELRAIVREELDALTRPGGGGK